LVGNKQKEYTLIGAVIRGKYEDTAINSSIKKKERWSDWCYGFK